MGLATFDGPQLLILDEPTNHLDIDSRAELIEAINDYEGACILVSHDRRLLEACVDRLWLVANGTVKPFDGDVADYGRFVLGQGAPPRAEEASRAGQARAGAEPQARPGPAKRELAALEAKMSRFQDLLRRVDEALAQASASAATRSRWPTSPAGAANSNGRWPPPRRPGSNCRRQAGGADRGRSRACQFRFRNEAFQAMRRLFRFRPNGRRSLPDSGQPVCRSRASATHSNSRGARRPPGVAA